MEGASYCLDGGTPRGWRGAHGVAGTLGPGFLGPSVEGPWGGRSWADESGVTLGLNLSRRDKHTKLINKITQFISSFAISEVL